MTTTRSNTPHSSVPAWLAAGVRAWDTSTGRIGIVQLLRDDLGEVRTEAIEHPTHAILRPESSDEPPWRVPIDSLTPPKGDQQ